jgi:HAD superfamily hydrolase (TIGR01490 family)
MNRAAIFDMDRTLVRKNTANLFVWWRLRNGKGSVKEAVRVVGWLAQYTFGVMDVAKVSEQALTSLTGLDETEFADECRLWYAESVRAHITDRARRAVEAAKAEGRVVAILSAATPYAVLPLAEELGIDHVLCTKLEIAEGRFTGRCLKPLCYGEGKVHIAEEWAARERIDLTRSAFYSDSVSDMPMLERVGEPQVINPDPRLRFAARSRGWPIDYWR